MNAKYKKGVLQAYSMLGFEKIFVQVSSGILFSIFHLEKIISIFQYMKR